MKVVCRSLTPSTCFNFLARNKFAFSTVSRTNTFAPTVQLFKSSRSLTTKKAPGEAETAQEACSLLELGGKAERTQIVEKEHTLDKRKIPGMEILSTPALIKWLEDTCAEIVDSKLAPKWNTVGYQVDFKHLSASKMGAEIVTKAQLKEAVAYEKDIDGDEDRLIGKGTHKRAVIAAEKSA